MNIFRHLVFFGRLFGAILWSILGLSLIILGPGIAWDMSRSWLSVLEPIAIGVSFVVFGYFLAFPPKSFSRVP